MRVGDDSLVESNTVGGNYETGIYVRLSDNILRKNHVTDSVSVGGISRCIYFSSSDNAAVDNTLTGCTNLFSGAPLPVSRSVGNIAW